MKKIVSIVLSMMFIITATITATGFSMVKAVSPTFTPDTSKEVHLVAYLPGDPQKDEQTFEDALNVMLKKDINATIEFKYISWGDFFQKYPLILASGEQFDLAYIASWADFSGQAQKGAFTDITKLVPKYCPDIMKIADKDAWKSATVKGKVYGIPTDGSQSYNMIGALYREDLRVKYKVPPIKKVEDFEAYMAAIKKNEKGMKPASMESVNNNYFLDFGMFEKTGLTTQGLQVTSGILGFDGLGYRQDDKAGRIVQITQTPQFKYETALMGRWQKMGFWDTSDMVNKTVTTDTAQSTFGQGKAAIWRGNTGNYNNTIEYFKKYHPTWKVGFYYPKSPTGNIDKTDALGNGMAVSSTSQNPERALMALNEILTKQDYKMLVSFGIKDKHYVLDSQGIPQLPAGITADKAPFGFYGNAFSWFVYNDSTMPSIKNDAYNVNQTLKKNSKAPALLGFNLDTTNIKGELAIVNDVLKQYQVPLTWGFFTKKGMDADIATLNANLKAGGIEKIQKEIQKQGNQFLKDNKK